jgi:hypothetical protein
MIRASILTAYDVQLVTVYLILQPMHNERVIMHAEVVGRSQRLKLPLSVNEKKQLVMHVQLKLLARIVYELWAPPSHHACCSALMVVVLLGGGTTGRHPLRCHVFQLQAQPNHRIAYDHVNLKMF